VVLRRCDVSPELWPESDDFCGADFVEVGWGDEGFYRAKKITLPLVLRAAFWPTPSVLHVAGLRGPVQQCFPASDIIELHVSDGQFDDLCRFISATLARDEALRPEKLGPGLYGESLFYRGKGKYYLPKTCNVWTAQALRAAGCPVLPAVAQTAENVLFQVGRRGHVLQHSARRLKKAALGGSSPGCRWRRSCARMAPRTRFFTRTTHAHEIRHLQRDVRGLAV